MIALVIGGNCKVDGIAINLQHLLRDEYSATKR